MADTGNLPRYDNVAKTFHWLIALGIIAMLALGWIMTSLPRGTDQFTLFQLHKSIGITILLLALLRLGWRLWHKPPPLPAAMRAWEKFAANGAHWVLYALMIGMPLLGWIMVSTHAEIPTILYGIVPWPSLPGLSDLPNKKEIGYMASDLHSFFAYVLAGIVVLHIGAAWKHHLFDRDDVLTRMAPEFLIRFLNRIRGQK